MTDSNWIQTFTGRRASVEMSEEDVSILDIAHALSNICRFNGHTHSFYSVAQHCVLGARVLAETNANAAREFLLHDAHEAYIGDITSPLKGMITERTSVVSTIEALLQVKIESAFGMCSRSHDSLVKETDVRMLQTERLQLFADQLDWRLDAEPLDLVITPWSPVVAEYEFLCLFNDMFRLTSDDEAAITKRLSKLRKLLDNASSQPSGDSRLAVDLEPYIVARVSNGAIVDYVTFDTLGQARKALELVEVQEWLKTGDKVQIIAPIEEYANEVRKTTLTDATTKPSDFLRRRGVCDTQRYGCESFGFMH